MPLDPALILGGVGALGSLFGGGRKDQRNLQRAQTNMINTQLGTYNQYMPDALAQLAQLSGANGMAAQNLDAANAATDADFARALSQIGGNLAQRGMGRSGVAAGVMRGATRDYARQRGANSLNANNQRAALLQQLAGLVSGQGGAGMAGAANLSAQYGAQDAAQGQQMQALGQIIGQMMAQRQAKASGSGVSNTTIYGPQAPQESMGPFYTPGRPNY